ncbi:RNA polymerase sigma factor [Streptomyces halstedii]|uniref:RNA polymerase sigma factor n=1 Tax=Streptomyces halstedii TaxID=1944 RepID=UPI0037D886BA
MLTNTSASTPPAPSQPDRGAAQRAADRELFEQLQADDFEGPRFGLLEDRFWRYGWNVLRSWMRQGIIIERCREHRIRFPAPYTEVEEMKRRADVRDDIAADCLSKAVPAFMNGEDSPLRYWNPDGGRNLTSFFLHFALWFYRDAYREWATSHRRRMRAILGPDRHVYDAGYEVWDVFREPGPEEQTVLQETLSIILAEASMEERAVCEAMRTGATQEEIAQQLGTTRKTVERRLSRVRGRTKKLAAAGIIVAPSVSSAVTR